MNTFILLLMKKSSIVNKKHNYSHNTLKINFQQSKNEIILKSQTSS